MQIWPGPSTAQSPPGAPQLLSGEYLPFSLVSKAQHGLVSVPCADSTTLPHNTHMCTYTCTHTHTGTPSHSSCALSLPSSCWPSPVWLLPALGTQLRLEAPTQLHGHWVPSPSRSRASFHCPPPRVRPYHVISRGQWAVLFPRQSIELTEGEILMILSLHRPAHVGSVGYGDAKDQSRLVTTRMTTA